MVQRTEVAYTSISWTASRYLGGSTTAWLSATLKISFLPTSAPLSHYPKSNPWDHSSSEVVSPEVLQLSFPLFDCDNAILDSFGVDLRFILLETSAHPRCVSGSQATLSAPSPVSQSPRSRADLYNATAHGAVLGYADAWLMFIVAAAAPVTASAFRAVCASARFPGVS